MLFILISLCLILDFIALLGVLSSLREREIRAALLCLLALALNSLFWGFLIHFQGAPSIRVFGWVCVAGTAVFAVFSLAPFFPRGDAETSIDENEDFVQVDERDVIFSRDNLQFHPEIAKTYYENNPELFEIDRKISQLTEMGREGGRFYDSHLTAVCSAGFKYLDRTMHAATGTKSRERISVDPEKMAGIIRRTALHYGAADVGFARPRKYHFYSHLGRHAETHGEAIEYEKYRTAIVIVVAMDPKRMKTAPTVGALLETSRQYVEAAKIAHVVAEYIRGFGYDARSHVNAHYETLCVPISAEAGLGEVGRMGLLMHPVHGPCIRTSIVTTELELPETKGRELHAERFCRICLKCADNCPVEAISKTGKSRKRGFEHWSVDQEKCYSYWKRCGTDCGICVAVCPYTKENTLFHKLARYYISRNSLNQRIGLFMDNILYGKSFSF